MCVVYTLGGNILCRRRDCAHFRGNSRNGSAISGAAVVASFHGGEQREEKTIFKGTMPGATLSLAPSHGKYSRLFQRNRDTCSFHGEFIILKRKQVVSIMNNNSQLYDIVAFDL